MPLRASKVKPVPYVASKVKPVPYVASKVKPVPLRDLKSQARALTWCIQTKVVFEIDFLRKLILEREILKIQQYDIYEKCSPDVGENDGRTFRIIGTHPEELLLHIHHSMISGFWTIFTDFRLQTKISRVIYPPPSGIEELWSCSIPKITKNSSRRTPRRNFDHQIGKSPEKKSKMMKIRILINLDVEVIAHSEVVQNAFKTLKLSIFDHISSSK